MGDLADFHGFEFEADYLLLADQFAEVPAVYIIYTKKSCLDIGETDRLKTELETHPHTPEWIRLAESKDLYLAFHLDPDKKSRVEKVEYLARKMQPLIPS